MSFASYSDPVTLGPSGNSGGLSSSSPLSLGGLNLGTAAAGGAGLAGLLTLGGGTGLPWEYGQLETNAGNLESDSGVLFNEGQTFQGQGQQTLNNAAAGVLTPPQQAALSVYQSGLENTADQQFATMGRNINQDTSGISVQADIDTKVNAMAQQDIQSSIALGLGQISEGNAITSESLGFENAANTALIAAGNAQIQADQSYSNALSGVFSAIGTIAGGAIGAAAGGPVGAVAGASIGRAL
jgi:hypothetical protein